MREQKVTPSELGAAGPEKKAERLGKWRNGLVWIITR